MGHLHPHRGHGVCNTHCLGGGVLKCWGYKSVIRNLQAFINILQLSSTVVYLMCY